MNTDFKPHPAVHRPWMFICGANPDDSVVTFAENPAKQIASALLEDIGDWHSAIANLQKTDVPPPVLDALGRLHDAVCGWTDWAEKTDKRTEATR
ncbi:hypothetical protein OEIGOIKO_05820 [Streptomyces chrestomyceticus JCM 4735]|uniref:Uncharacterized protein n=1 Tax=Streptomyces chrestomyceticus JCM 4735 TaxID=1306181 RepID=A0A7U9KYZ3_9ACTN|nr:hypothetical protein [Streptomyces chrestomyceticus]GCD38010.1 hypothetical protein OEIGOIKO_05820 [Streptomyces chrestomyceticus JCM 4735]